VFHADGTLRMGPLPCVKYMVCAKRGAAETAAMLGDTAWRKTFCARRKPSRAVYASVLVAELDLRPRLDGQKHLPVRT
jgi:hypothetical protein